MSALDINSTWKIVDKPRDKKVVQCNWIFKLKYDADG